MPVYMRSYIALAFALVFIYNLVPVSCSEGDRSPFYENCVRNCLSKNCTEGGAAFTSKAALQQDSWARLLRWSCKEECRYQCMWRTVSAYEERGFPIPKFHGKWPFERIYGVQEPGSALASALNLAAHAYMYVQLIKDKRFSLASTPLLLFWHLFFIVCMHAWTWSAIFHARDTPFTEFMDYACALSMVTAFFVAAVVRLLHRRRVAAAVVLLLTFAYFAEHVRYLYAGRIDYDYNMTVNVICGMAGTALWLWVSVRAMWAGRRGAWQLAAFCKLSAAAVLLELLDFPPYGRLVDAHALWHFATAPLPLLFYRFVIHDLDQLQTDKMAEKKTDYKLA